MLAVTKAMDVIATRVESKALLYNNNQYSLRKEWREITDIAAERIDRSVEAEQVVADDPASSELLVVDAQESGGPLLRKISRRSSFG